MPLGFASRRRGAEDVSWLDLDAGLKRGRRPRSSAADTRLLYARPSASWGTGSRCGDAHGHRGWRDRKATAWPAERGGAPGRRRHRNGRPDRCHRRSAPSHRRRSPRRARRTTSPREPSSRTPRRSSTSTRCRKPGRCPPCGPVRRASARDRQSRASRERLRSCSRWFSGPVPQHMIVMPALRAMTRCAATSSACRSFIGSRRAATPTMTSRPRRPTALSSPSARHRKAETARCLCRWESSRHAVPEIRA